MLTDTRMYVMDQEIRSSFTIVEGGPPEPAPRSLTLGATFFALTFLVGLWLVVSPFVFGYGMVGARLTVHAILFMIVS